MKDEIEEVKKRIDIVEYIGHFITLKKSGRNFKACCPFHQEKNPSFIVSPDRQRWHCFGACSTGGDIISFVMKYENITFYEALTDLAEKVGVKITRKNISDDAWTKKQRLIAINTYAQKIFHYILLNKDIAAKARKYLEERDISDKLIESFQIGYAPPNFSTLIPLLSKKNFSTSEIFESGLLIKGEGGRYWDRFRDRIIFPIKDTRGNTIGFSGRLISESEKEAKYINTPETLLYKKRETLFGIHLTKENIQKNGRAVIVEGEFDMISCFKHGINNAVAIKGSACTREQLMLLKRYTDRIILALDTDAAGEETTKRALSDAQSLEFKVDIAVFEDGKDPDEALSKNPLSFKKAIADPVPFYDYIIDTALKKTPPSSAYAKKTIADEVIPYISTIENPIIFEHYNKKLARALEVDEQTIKKAIDQYKKKKERRKVAILQKQSTPQNRYEFLQQFILGVLFQSKNPKNCFEKIFSIIETSDFSIPSYITLIERFKEQVIEKDKKSYDINKFLASIPPHLTDVFDTLFLFDTNDEFEKISGSLTKLCLELKRYSLKKKISDLLKESKEDKNIQSKIKELTKALAEIEKKQAFI